MRNIVITTLLALLALASCRNKETVSTTVEGFAEGTYFHIVYMSRDTLHLEHAIDSLLTVIDNSMSIFNPSSLLSRLNRNETDSLDAYITHCITLAQQVSGMSGGMYDITVKPLVEAWGFATQEQELEPNLDSLLQFVGYDKISIENGRLRKTDPRVQIDLNSIAKGYTSDLVAELLESRGVKRYVVEIGGEVVARGLNLEGVPWRVGIDQPVEGNVTAQTQVQVVLSLQDQCVATSGNYRNYHYDSEGRKIVHTINPKTGQSAAGSLLSATVVTDRCVWSDALATAMMALGTQEAIKLVEANPGILAYLIYTDEAGKYQIWASPGLQKLILE